MRAPAFGVWHLPCFFDLRSIVVMSALADIALVKRDPRLRATGRPPG
jgi:hypothetical protein